MTRAEAGVILYAEVPDFYAEIERMRDASLAARPIIVGGDPRKRGRVQSASREARASGVVLGMPVREAIGRCPAAALFRTEMKRYREVSGLLRQRLREVVPVVEPAALESAFLDAGSALDPEALGLALVDRVQATLRLPLRVGAASVKFLARLAAEEAGSSQVRCIARGTETAFLAPLPLDRLPGVGPKTLATLKALGAERVGDLTRLDPEVLEEALGNHGLRIRELALGREDSVVRGAAHPKSLSREHTYDEPQVDLPELWEQLQLLAQLLQEGLAGQGLAGRRVTVKVRYADHQTTTRSATLQRPIATAADVYEHAVRLLERTHAGARPVRLLGISLSDLGAAPEDRQLELFAGPQ